MRYISTRGGKNEFLTAAETIVKGIADNGGLFVPEETPLLDNIKSTLAALTTADYNTHAEKIMQLFFTDYTPDELSACINGAYNAQNFTAPEIAPLAQIPDTNVSFLELFHGKTLAFKDIALSLLPHLMQTALHKTNNTKTQIILTATSGDTGVSALEGFKNIDGMKIIVFYPENGVSVIQKQHMLTQTEKNVCVVGVNGNFDDAQTEVKRMFLDPALREQLNSMNCEFSSANSINTGRLVPQVVYYFYAYSQLVKTGLSNGTPVNFVVPTGNFGNILAGYYAKKMGLPINKLICASNENKVLTDYFDTGVFDSNRPFYLTATPSMDILIPSNFERLVFDLSRDAGNERLAKLSAKQKFTMEVPPDFVGFYASEVEVKAAINKVFANHNYLMDPHTAVGYIAYEKYNTLDQPTVIVSTASPFKFAKTVMTSVNEKYAAYNDFALLAQMADLTKSAVPPQFAGLETAPKLHSRVSDIAGMQDAVIDFIKA